MDISNPAYWQRRWGNSFRQSATPQREALAGQYESPILASVVQDLRRGEKPQSYGKLRQFLSLPFGRLTLKELEIRPGINLLDFSYDFAIETPYQLLFEPANEQFSLNLWEYTMPLTRKAQSVSIAESTSSTGTTTPVDAATTETPLLAANSNRKGATIYNDSSETLYIDFNASVSATDYAVSLGQDDFYEVPYGYTGIIYGIWTGNIGKARVVEFT